MKIVNFFSRSLGIIFLFVNIIAMNAQTGYNIGDVATDFSLQNIDGQMVSLSDYEYAKAYIVIFTCNSCPYAILYEDRIIELRNTYSEKDYPIIAINPNDPEIKPEDSFEQMKIRAHEKGFNFPYVFDADQIVFPQYGARKTPHVFLLDPNRVVRYIGAIDDNPRDVTLVEEKYLENAISALAQGKTPHPETTKAIGCTIKIKS